MGLLYLVQRRKFGAVWPVYEPHNINYTYSPLCRTQICEAVKQVFFSEVLIKCCHDSWK